MARHDASWFSGAIGRPLEPSKIQACGRGARGVVGAFLPARPRARGEPPGATRPLGRRRRVLVPGYEGLVADAVDASAKLPCPRPLPLHVRVDPTGDPAVLHRNRPRGRALLALNALAHLPALQGAARHARAWHAARRLQGGLRMDQPLDVPGASQRREQARSNRRSSMHQALLGLPPQHLGDELRRALGERDQRSQPRGETWWVLSQHWRGRSLQVSPSRWRRRLEHWHRILCVRQESARRLARV
mmetsp:Transcript_14459/g.30552  ORF Transcript_14459/g.30552 Transcript_14459/m.30552 type:complete len:246 (-) Transcript_14459:589-1326(-)